MQYPAGIVISSQTFLMRDCTPWEEDTPSYCNFGSQLALDSAFVQWLELSWLERFL